MSSSSPDPGLITTSDGRVDPHGHRYWEVEVWRMLPLYQQLYERIFTERLKLWGAGSHGIVRRTPGSIVYGGPDRLMRDLNPAAVVRRRLVAGDQDWVGSKEREWRSAAAAFEQHAERFWSTLLAGRPACEDLRSLLQVKVAFNAIGMDSIMPTVEEGKRWLTPHMAEDLAGDVLDACFLPAAGRIAYDEFELESRMLARAFQPDEPMPEAARSRFVTRGLFYCYDALDTTRRTYFLEVFPRRLALRYRRAAPGSGALDAGIAEVGDRPWRRRLHRQWGRQQLEQVGVPEARALLLTLYRFVGSARDYDEEKRRINMKLWRGLFALADGLGVSLMGSAGTVEGLCGALAERKTALAVDPVFLTDT